MKFSKEFGLGLVCLVVGGANTAILLNNGEAPTFGIMLLALSLFWFNGGLTGHGSM